MRNIFTHTFYFALFLFPINLLANSGGAPDGLASNPPNRANCTQCHGSFGLNTGNGSLELLDYPAEYTPGEEYRITIQLSDPNASRWGFQLTAIDEEDDRAGDLSVVNGNQTRISDRNGRPQYLMQRSNGTFPNQRNRAAWEFDWTAPDDDIGPIWFYMTGNAANNNRNTAGDRIYATNFRMPAAEPPPPDPDVFELTLNEGWNLVSSIVAPDTADIQTIFADLIADSSLNHIRNSSGEFFNRLTGEGELETWEADRAYQVNMAMEATVIFSGTFVDSAAEYSLSEGWNWLPYPRHDDSHPVEAFAAYSETIEIVKDNSGIFWSAGDSLNYMTIITPGSAVMVKASADVEFFWAEPAGEMDQPIELMLPQHFAIPLNTGKNMSMLITSWDNINLVENDELALMNGEGMIFGSVMVQNIIQPLVVWGDDDTTPEDIEGFLTDSTLHFVYYNSEADEEIVAYAVGDDGDSTLTYADDSFIRLSVGIFIDGISDGSEAFRIENFEIVSLYPNPFNQSTALEFTLRTPANVSVSLRSIDGRLLQVLRNRRFEAGMHSVSINANGLSAGMYFIGMQSDAQQIVRTIIFLP